MATILLIEDDHLNRDVIALYLRSSGYEVATACDGGEGLASALATLPDLVVLDMSLPVIDGWELVRRLRATTATSRIPVVAVTAYAMDGDRELCLAAGCDEYCSKPVNFQELIAKIERLLRPGA